MQSDRNVTSYYAVLQLIDFAEDAAIKSAYKYLSQKWHPDKNPNRQEEAAIRFKEINYAYKILSNSILKDKHDSMLMKRKEDRKSHTSENSNNFSRNDGVSSVFEKKAILWLFALIVYSFIFGYIVNKEFFELPSYAKKLQVSGIEGTGSYINFIKEHRNSNGDHRGYLYQIMVEDMVFHISTYSYLQKFGKTFPIVYDRSALLSKKRLHTGDFYIGRKGVTKAEFNWAREAPGDSKDTIFGMTVMLIIYIYILLRVFNFTAIFRRIF